MKTINKGDIVESLAGHDKGNILLVMSVSEDQKYVFLSDGRLRTVKKPKRKKIKHCKKISIEPVKDQIGSLTDAEVRKIIKLFLN